MNETVETKDCNNETTQKAAVFPQINKSNHRMQLSHVSAQKTSGMVEVPSKVNE